MRGSLPRIPLLLALADKAPHPDLLPVKDGEKEEEAPVLALGSPSTSSLSEAEIELSAVGRQKGKAREMARWRMPAPIVPPRRASCYRDEAGVDPIPATWSALLAQLRAGAWIAAEWLLPRASGWRLVAADDDGSWQHFAGHLGQRPTRARRAIAETRERALRQK